uniref:RRM domain-containing protein n=1 Tax=Aegilops tauschii subsp. strangulata TaxID=200361 RepID=A0A453QPJ1_AEGTS
VGDPYYHLYAPQPLQHPDPRQGVVTLFVAGLPDDVKPREIHNLFSRRPGFDHCLLEYTGRGNQAVAFVSFFTHHAALAAMDSLNGSVFDPDNGDCLHIELAKSNSRKRHGGGGEVYRVIDKRVRTEENSDNDNNRDEGDDDVSGNDDGNGHTYLIISHICNGVGPQLNISSKPL